MTNLSESLSSVVGGDLAESIVAVVNDDLARRTQEAKRHKAESGRKAAGDYPYGYRGVGSAGDRDAEPNPREQAAVAAILRWRREGLSYRAIAARLDAAGMPPRRAERWSAMSVRAVVLAQGGLP